MTEASNYKWWLWPLMPFAAVAGAVVGTAVVSALIWFSTKLSGGFSEDGWYFLYIIPVITSVTFGVIYAWISYHISPSGKLVAGTVMVTLLGALMAVGVFLTWMHSERGMGSQIQVTVSSIATFIGGVGAIFHAHNESQ